MVSNKIVAFVHPFMLIGMCRMKRHIFLFLMLILLSPITSKANSEIKLYEDKIGEMPLSHSMKLSYLTMLEVLKPFSVIKKSGQQDGPDFIYYEISKNNIEYFWIKTRDKNERLLDRVYITNKSIIDQYAVSIGTQYKQIQKLRPQIKITTDYHYHTYAYVSGSNIMYEITGDFEGPDRQDFTDKEVANWKVSNIVWLKLNE